MNPIERLKQSSNITEKIYVSYKDRIGLDSTSKGSQTRWYKNGLFIKLDYLGYEDLSEELVSKLLDFLMLITLGILFVRYMKIISL